MRIVRWLVPALLAPVAAGGQSAAGPTGSAQWADSIRREVEGATIESNDQRFRDALALADRALTASSNDPLLLHYKGYALYRQASIHIGRRQEKEAKALLEQADEVLEKSAAKLPMAETHALRSAVLGQLIGLSSNPLAGMTMGPRASGQMDRAMELGPSNPRVWLLHGISGIFTPGMFGGGLDRAEERLRKSIELYERDRPAPPAPAWGLADAHAWLGQVMERRGKREEARAAYEKALEVEPDYRWVQGLLAKVQQPAP
jgi:tetratricopeptide (TPR) repeat protein